MAGGLIGLGVRSPPRFGQIPASTPSAQVTQYVHS
jgi:hypothetical protein